MSPEALTPTVTTFRPTALRPAVGTVAGAEQARAAGYAAGYAAGARAAAEAGEQQQRRLAEEHVRSQATRDAVVGQALGLLERAVAAADRRSAPAVAAARHELHRCAVELAEAVLGRELAADGVPAVLDRVLALPTDLGPCTVRLHPADLARVRAVLEAGTHALPAGVALAADAGLAPGDVVAEHATGHLDATIRGALDRARAVLAESDDDGSRQ